MKLCLAGVSHQSAIKKMKEGIQPLFMLESFYMIKADEIPYIKKAKLFLLDSGAFSFMSNANRGKKITFEEINKYADKYIKFINDNDIKYFFELDVDTIFGYEKVLELRKKIEEKTGKKCIPVFHKNRGLDEWIKMCKEYDYVAIGCSGKNDSAWTKDINILKQMLKIANKYNTKVHGLGFTRTGELETIPFYSVDSTSWLGSRFGIVYEFKNNKMNKITKQGYRLKNAVNTEEHNFQEWIKYQKFLAKETY